jgi:hypothetical protein
LLVALGRPPLSRRCARQDHGIPRIGSASFSDATAAA